MYIYIYIYNVTLNFKLDHKMREIKHVRNIVTLWIAHIMINYKYKVLDPKAQNMIYPSRWPSSPNYKKSDIN